MLSDLEREEKKQQILHDCFDLFVMQGLENTSMNDLAKYCDTYKAAFYHYFKSKDEIVIESAKMYMMELNDKIAELLSQSIVSLKQLFEHGVALLSLEKNKLRYIYQVVSSPKYGEDSRKALSKIYAKTFDYSRVIAKQYGVDHEEFRPYYLIFVATIHDYCLWEDESLVKEKLDFLIRSIEGISYR